MPARIEEVLRDSGFRDIEVQRMTYRSEMPIEDYLAGRETTAVPANRSFARRCRLRASSTRE